MYIYVLWMQKCTGLICTVHVLTCNVCLYKELYSKQSTYSVHAHVCTCTVNVYFELCFQQGALPILLYQLQFIEVGREIL